MAKSRPTKESIHRRIKERLIESLCTEFRDISLFDLQEAIHGNPELNQVLGGITVGELMLADATPKPSKTNGKALEATTLVEHPSHNTERPKPQHPIKLVRPAIDNSMDLFDTRIHQWIQARGPLSQAQLTNEIHGAANPGTRHQTDIRVQQATQRLADAGKIESVKQGEVWYHQPKK